MHRRPPASPHKSSPSQLLQRMELERASPELGAGACGEGAAGGRSPPRARSPPRVLSGGMARSPPSSPVAPSGGGGAGLRVRAAPPSPPRGTLRRASGLGAGPGGLPPRVGGARALRSAFRRDFAELGVIGRGRCVQSAGASPARQRRVWEGCRGPGGAVRSFGAVLRVRKRLDRQLYAVKRVELQSRRVRSDEVTALSRVEDTTHVVRYFSSWAEDGVLYIQTELCDGNAFALGRRVGDWLHASGMPHVREQLAREAAVVAAARARDETLRDENDDDDDVDDVDGGGGGGDDDADGDQQDAGGDRERQAEEERGDSGRREGSRATAEGARGSAAAAAAARHGLRVNVASAGAAAKDDGLVTPVAGGAAGGAAAAAAAAASPTAGMAWHGPCEGFLLALLRQALLGLRALHEADPPIVHLDIKSSNLLYLLRRRRRDSCAADGPPPPASPGALAAPSSPEAEAVRDRSLFESALTFKIGDLGLARVMRHPPAAPRPAPPDPRAAAATAPDPARAPEDRAQFGASVSQWARLQRARAPSPPVDDGDGRYMSPELMAGGVPEALLPASDIFSLGLALFELARGAPLPTGGADFQELRSGAGAQALVRETLAAAGPYSRALADLLAATLTSDPRARPSAAQLLQHPLLRSPAEALLSRVLATERALVSELRRRIVGPGEDPCDGDGDDDDDRGAADLDRTREHRRDEEEEDDEGGGGGAERAALRRSTAQGDWQGSGRAQHAPSQLGRRDRSPRSLFSDEADGGLERLLHEQGPRSSSDQDELLAPPSAASMWASSAATRAYDQDTRSAHMVPIPSPARKVRRTNVASDSRGASFLFASPLTPAAAVAAAALHPATQARLLHEGAALAVPSPPSPRTSLVRRGVLQAPLRRIAFPPDAPALAVITDPAPHDDGAATAAIALALADAADPTPRTLQSASNAVAHFARLLERQARQQPQQP